MTDRQSLMCYYGYSFESYCTSPTPTRASMAPGRPGDPPGWGGDVNTNVQWCSVVKSKIGDIRLVIGGEVDCVRGSPVIEIDDWILNLVFFIERYTGQPDTFVELKTSQAIRSSQDAARFERWAF
jgi:RAT1-interacting protein